MKTLALFENDLEFENGDFKLVESEEEVAHCLAISLGTNLKEWFLNEEFGIDFTMLRGKSSEDEVRAEVMRVIAQENRVDTINSVNISSDTQNRKRSITFDVTLVDGFNLVREVAIDGAYD